MYSTAFLRMTAFESCVPLQYGTLFLSCWNPPLIFSRLRCSERMCACLREETLVEDGKVLMIGIEGVAGSSCSVLIAVGEAGSSSYS